MATPIQSLNATFAADYIIIGGGTAGLVLANHLSSNPERIVIVVEAGQDDRGDDRVEDPFIWQQAQNTELDWAYEEPSTDGRRTLVHHAGKTLGGTSMINGLNYIRPSSAEIDAWEHLGATGWNWETLWPYFLDSEHFQPPTSLQQESGATYDSLFHNLETGDVKVGYHDDMRKPGFFQLLSSTWHSLGVSTMQDPNGGDLRGFSSRPWTLDTKAQTRFGAAHAYYTPVEKRSNLKVLQGTASRILWCGSSAEGKSVHAKSVEYIDGASIARQRLDLTDHGEVILTAGSLRTPLILEASGIGSPAHLAELGIDLIIDLPGVGANLQEQANLLFSLQPSEKREGHTPYAAWLTAQDVFKEDTGKISRQTRAELPNWAREMTTRNPGLDLDAAQAILQVQHDLIFQNNVALGEIVFVEASRTLTGFWGLLPFARGSVHLRHGETDQESSLEGPDIFSNLLGLDFDLDCLVGVGRFARNFWATKPAEDLAHPDEQTYPPVNATEQEWRSFIKENFVPNHHPVGTAAMMSRELGGVVGSDLMVYGTGNVRVADASVIPLQVTGHLVATIYAIAKRAVDIITDKNRD